VTVALRHADGRVILTVSDDGRGLPTARHESGLSGMRERALLIEAELEVRSATGRGTEITLSVPAGVAQT
jgi:two-component system, NarL family, sensor histidine kinase UhpB